MKKGIRLLPLFLILGGLLLIIFTLAIPGVPKKVYITIEKPKYYKPLPIQYKHPLLMETSDEVLLASGKKYYDTIKTKYKWNFYVDGTLITYNNKFLFDKVSEDLYWSCYWILQFPHKLLKFISDNGPPSIYFYTIPNPPSCPVGAPACGFKDIHLGYKITKWVFCHEFGHLLTYYCFTDKEGDPLKGKSIEDLFGQEPEGWDRDVEDGKPFGYATYESFYDSSEDFCNSVRAYISPYDSFHFSNFKNKALIEFALGYSLLLDKYNFIKQNIFLGKEFFTPPFSPFIAVYCVIEEDVKPASQNNFTFHLRPLVDLPSGTITISLWSKNKNETIDFTKIIEFTQKGDLISNGPIETSFYVKPSNITERDTLFIQIYYHPSGSMLMDPGIQLAGTFDFSIIIPDKHPNQKYHPHIYNLYTEESGIKTGIENSDYFLQLKSDKVTPFSTPGDKDAIIDVDLVDRIIFQAPYDLGGKLRKVYIYNPEPENSDLVTISIGIYGPMDWKTKSMKVNPLDKSIWILCKNSYLEETQSLLKQSLFRFNYSGNLLLNKSLDEVTKDPINKTRLDKDGNMWFSGKNTIFHIGPQGEIGNAISISDDILDFFVADNTLWVVVLSLEELRIKRYTIYNDSATLTGNYYTNLKYGEDYSLLFEVSPLDNSIWFSHINNKEEKTSLLKLNNSLKMDFLIDGIKGIGLQLIMNPDTGSCLLNLSGSPCPKKDWLLRFSSKGQLIAADFGPYGYVFED